MGPIRPGTSSNQNGQYGERYGAQNTSQSGGIDTSSAEYKAKQTQIYSLLASSQQRSPQKSGGGFTKIILGVLFAIVLVFLCSCSCPCYLPTLACSGSGSLASGDSISGKSGSGSFNDLSGNTKKDDDDDKKDS